MEKYYQIKKVSSTSAQIFIYGDIVDQTSENEEAVSAAGFAKELQNLFEVKEIEVRIQSYGGSVFSGVAIYNMLKNHPATITVHIDGVACSIATVIAMAGDRIVMPQNSMMMIHNPMYGVSFGNAKDLRKMADDLDKIRESSISAYLAKAQDQLSREQLLEMLDQETWLSAKECFDLGLCDEVVDSVDLVAKFTKSSIVGELQKNPIKFDEKKEDEKMVMKLNKSNLEDMYAERDEFLAKHKDNSQEELIQSYPWYGNLVEKISAEEQKKSDWMNEQQRSKQVNVKKDPSLEFEKNGKLIQVLTPEQKMTVVDASSYEQKEFKNLSLGKLIRGMATGDWKDSDKEQQVVAANRDGSGGVLIPAPLSNELINMVRAKSVLMNAGARTVPMTSSTLVFAKQISDVVPHWKAEGAAIVQSDANFEPVKFEAKTLVGMADLTIELLEDALNIDSIVTDSIVNALALELDRAGLLGAGTDIEPKGIYNYEDITKVPVGKELDSYKDFSKAVTSILSQDGTPNGVIFSPRTYGELDNLTDSTGQPLNAPQSYQELTHKLTTTQVPNNLGEGLDGSFAVVGDFTQLWYGLRTGITIEVSRVADDAFSKMKFKVRAYLRADVQPVHQSHFIILDDIK